MSRKSVQRFCDNDMHENKGLKRVALKRIPQYTTHWVLMVLGKVLSHAVSAFWGEKLIHALRASSPMRNHDFSHRPWAFRLMAFIPMVWVAHR
ncbi:hypothetical protein FJ418_25810 [Mesorhizobium sp. B2-8-3]|nr:hypothetical protein FJ418_25810 [Mesorhizobium sp. B2-8-3]